MKSPLALMMVLIAGLNAKAQVQTGPNIGLKNFRSIYFSMLRVTGVKPTEEIRAHYQAIMSRFPRDGRVNEFSTSVALAQKDLAGLVCKEFSKSYQAPGDFNNALSDLSDRFYQRPMSVAEAKMLTDLVAKLRPQTNKTFMVCSAMLSAEEFLVQK